MNYRLCPECKHEFLQTYRQQVCCSRACKIARRKRIVNEWMKRDMARTISANGAAPSRLKIIGAKPPQQNIPIVEAAGADGAAPSQPDAARAYADRLIAESETRAAERQRWNERKAERARLAAITAHPVAETVATREDGSRVIRRGNCPVASWA